MAPDSFPSLDDSPRLEFLNPCWDVPKSPLDLAMADDPPLAAAEEVLRQCRPLESLGRTGPRTAEGKETSSKNSLIHGCCVTKHSAADKAEIELIVASLLAETGAESDAEIADIERAAEALFRWNKCHRAIQDLTFTVVDRTKAERRQPLEERVLAIETSLNIWEDLQTQAFPFGKGYGDAYPILLKDLDPCSSVKTLRAPRAREFAYRHTMAQASPRMLALHQKFARAGAEVEKGPELNEYLGGKAVIDNEFSRLAGWVMLHVMDLREQLDKAKRDLARVDAEPLNRDLLVLLSDDYRKLHRYQSEAESAYHRNMRGFDLNRKRLMTSYDNNMNKIQREYPVMVKVGALGIHLPKELSGLSPYDRLEAIVKVLVREQRFYDRRSRNEFRKTAEMAKVHENHHVTPTAPRNAPLIDGQPWRPRVDLTAVPPAESPPPGAAGPDASR